MNDHPLRMQSFARSIGLSIVPLLAMTAWTLAADKPESASKTIVAPKSIDQGFAMAEKLLGKHSEKTAHEWRFPIESDTPLGEINGQQVIHVKLAGVMTFGTPYRYGDSIAFDLVSAFERTRFELDPIVKKQRGHFTFLISIVLT
jgi:hypothetical protein